MEKLAAERKQQVLDNKFCQKLAEEFNCSAGRAGSKVLQATQVQGWFHDKFPESATKPICVPAVPQEKASGSEVNVSVSKKKSAASEIFFSLLIQVFQTTRMRFLLFFH